MRINHRADPQRRSIVVSEPPRGRHVEGKLAEEVESALPGQHIVLNDDGEYELWNGAADGEQDEVIVLVEDPLQGKTFEQAYTGGDWFRAYIPVSGDELLVLAKNLTGTGSGTDDEFDMGDKLIIEDGSGKVIKTTGTPEMEPYKVVEAVDSLLADKLILVRRL